MRLVKEGIDPKKVLRRVVCIKCTSEYEFTLADPELTYTYDQRDGNFYSFTCKVCSLTIYVSDMPTPPRDRFTRGEIR